MKAIFNIGYTSATPPASYTGERRADYIAKRNFYNLTADYNYFTYTLNGQRFQKTLMQIITLPVKVRIPGFSIWMAPSMKKRKTSLKLA